MGGWKTAFMASLGYATMDAADVIDSLHRLGYQGIEWTTSHFDPYKPAAELSLLTKRTRDAGMEVSRIMAHEDFVSLDAATRRTRIDRTIRVIEAAGACGVTNVGTMTGPAPWDPTAPKLGTDITEGEAWEQVLEAYSELIPAAESAHVTITIEGVFGMVAHDFYSHKYLMDQLDTGVCKVNLDPSHGVLYGNLDVGWVVKQWGDRIGHVHLKDAVGVPRIGEFVFPLLGEGNVDWSAFFDALAEIRYEGFCSVEFESFDYYERVLAGDPERAARVSMDAIQRLSGLS